MYIPVIQKELDTFCVSVWNNHQTRKQKGKVLPSGVLDHIYNYPEQYGGEKCGLDVTEEQLQEVSEMSSILEASDFLDDAFHLECERHIPNTDEISPSEVDNAYLILKANFDESRV